MKKLMMIALAAIFTLTGSLAMAQPPQGGQGGRGERQTAEQRIAQLKEQLDLSDEQCEQLLAFETERAEAEQPERGDREAMQKMMAAEQEEMKKILTEEQYAKWEEMMKNRRQGQGQGQGQGRGQRQ